MKPQPLVKHYEVLLTGSNFAVKLNPKAYEVGFFRGRPPKDAILAFNTNYSWLGVPIGICRSGFKPVLPSIPTKIDKRPTLTFDNVNNVHIVGPDALPTDAKRIIDASRVAAQAGPLLVSYGSLCYIAGCYNGEFKADAIRKTQHVAVGVTRAGKVVVLWAESMGMEQLAEEMRHLGCEFAMKCDGGHQAYFGFKEPREPGSTGLSFNLERGNQGKIVAGIYFRERQQR
jgi:hypothetical protein